MTEICQKQKNMFDTVCVNTLSQDINADNQMLGVKQMNNIANQAREIIYNEIIYHY